MEYVVYLTMYSGDKLPRWYIGSSTRYRVLNGYRGSVTSRKWRDVYKEEISNNPNLFKSRILSFHNTRNEAVIEENRIQHLHSVVKNENYFNESYATKGGCFTRDKRGELNPMFGKGYLLRGKKNGRHKDNYKGDMSEVSKRMSDSLKKLKNNKKGLNTSAKKYYAYYEPLNLYMDIDKGYLRNFTEALGIKYNSLWNTLKTGKPIGKRGCTPGPGYQLFEGSYNGN